MDEDRLTIDPPVYLIGKMYACWRCGAKMPVVAILAPQVEGTEGEICILSEITELPEAILAYIQGRVPTFKLQFSKTIGQKYFASTCVPSAACCREISICMPSLEPRSSRPMRTRLRRCT